MQQTAFLLLASSCGQQRVRHYMIKKPNRKLLWDVSRAHVCSSVFCSKPVSRASLRFISDEQPGAVPPPLRWPHTSRLVWAHIKCFSHPTRPLKVNNPQRMRHLLQSDAILHTWQVSVCAKARRRERRKRRQGGMMMCYVLILQPQCCSCRWLLPVSGCLNKTCRGMSLRPASLFALRIKQPITSQRSVH